MAMSDASLAAAPEAPELRLTLIDALGYLSPRDRAVAVVKKQSARSLARLRELLGDLLED